MPVAKKLRFFKRWTTKEETAEAPVVGGGGVSPEASESVMGYDVVDDTPTKVDVTVGTPISSLQPETNYTVTGP